MDGACFKLLQSLTPFLFIQGELDAHLCLLFAQCILWSVALIIAVTTIHSSRKSSKLTATINIINTLTLDREFDSAKKLLAPLFRNTNVNFSRYADVSIPENISELNEDEQKRAYDDLKVREAITFILSQYEFIACGIKCGAFDKNTVKTMQYSFIVNLTEKFDGFIIETRKQAQRDTLFMDLVQLANDFKESPLKPPKK